jgi:hypothetical protein
MNTTQLKTKTDKITKMKEIFKSHSEISFSNLRTSIKAGNETVQNYLKVINELPGWDIRIYTRWKVHYNAIFDPNLHHRDLSHTIIKIHSTGT